MKAKALILLVCIALLLSACSAARATQSTAPMEPGFASSDSGKGMDIGREEAEMPAAAPQQPEGDFTGGNSATAAERIVIKNASLTIIVVDPAASIDTINRMAEEMGGFVVTSNLYKVRTENGEELPEGSITIRVPAAQLNDALAQIKGLVRNPVEHVLLENVAGQDVTQAYTDLQSRLRNLEDAEAQLREIMASATKTEDVLNVFNQLTYIREQIEVTKGQIQYYEESAALSSIAVTVRAEESVQPLTIGGWQPAGVARDAVQALINVMQFLVNALIWIVIVLLPVGLVFGGLVWLLTWLIRKLRGPRRPKAVIPPAAAPPSAD